MAIAAVLAGCATAERADMTWATLDGKPPIVIAHRGASGYLPEHTLAAYALAIDQGADVVESDLVFTKDGVLVARHDRYLSTTTDVADHPEFAARKRANNDPADAPREDWWVEDFTLAELKTLRARRPFPGRSNAFDGLHEIPTFDEMLALVSAKAKEAGRDVGVYPETKHPGFFASIGHDFEKPLLDALKAFDAGPVFIQSFKPEILMRLKGKTKAKLVQLVYEEKPGAGPNIPPSRIATYADGIGLDKGILFNDWGQASAFVNALHELGLFAHVWTFRDDTSLADFGRPFSPNARYCVGEPEDFSDAKLEIYAAFTFGSDGVFTDYPATAAQLRACFREPGVIP